MYNLIEPAQFQVVEYTPDPSHEYVAGVQFSYMGYGGCTVAIADKTDKVLVTVVHLANVEGIKHENQWIIQQFEKWNVIDWRFLSEAADERSIYSLNYLGESMTYNQRAGELAEMSGFKKMHLHRVNYRNDDGGWWPDIFEQIELIKSKKVKVADPKFRSAMFDIQFRENNRGGYKIRFPIKGANLIYAGLLACIEMNTDYFTISKKDLTFYFG